MAAKMDFSVLVSSATTANQTIVSVLFAAATSYKVIAIGCSYTTYSATEGQLGIGMLAYASDGTTYAQCFEQRFQNTDLDNNCGMSILPLGAGITFSAGTAVKAYATPWTATSCRWPASLWGDT